MWMPRPPLGRDPHGLPGRPLFSPWALLPTAVSVLLLLLASIRVFGNVFRPGLAGELVLVFYLSALGLACQRNERRGAMLIGAVVLAVYLLCWAKWVVFREAVTVADLLVIPEAFSILPAAVRVGVVVATALVGAGLLANVALPTTRHAVVLGMPLFMYAAVVWGRPDGVAHALEQVRPQTFWAPGEDGWRNGPLVELAREFARLSVWRQDLEREVDVGERPPLLDVDALRTAPPQRNLHVVVMESLFDPLRVRGAQFDSDPFDPRFRRWMREGNSLALAATFGGQSARSEFEILCGVPAYGMLGVDFQALRGAPIPCLPRALRELGYTTMASVPVNASFFNANTAYVAAGFAYRYFDNHFAHDDLDGELVSDATVFARNLHDLERFAGSASPVLNYVVTYSGHRPFTMNPVRRPPVFPGDAPIVLAANAAYYNTRAVADFVAALEARDPDAVVLVLADHLPLLTLDATGGPADDYRFGLAASPAHAAGERQWLESRATILVARRAGLTVPLGLIPHYGLPEVMLDLISDGAYCASRHCLAAEPVRYRPDGHRDVFTTAERFPTEVCRSGPAPADADGSDVCAAAVRLRNEARRAYRQLLRLGVRHADAPRD
jgi:hypothetical protein